MPTHSLSNFYNHLIKTPPLFSTQYRLSIVGGAVDYFTKYNEELSMMARGATIPGIKQNGIELDYMGFKFSQPTNFTMSNELKLSVICDNKMNFYDGFVAWTMNFNNIWNEDGTALGMGNGNKNYADNARTVIYLDILDENYNPTGSVYKLHGAYPISVGEIEMNTEDVNVIKFAIDLKYQYWTKTKPKQKKIETAQQQKKSPKEQNQLNSVAEQIDVERQARVALAEALNAKAFSANATKEEKAKIDETINQQLALINDKSLTESFQQQDKAQEIINQMYGGNTGEKQNTGWDVQKQLISQLNSNQNSVSRTPEQDKLDLAVALNAKQYGANLTPQEKTSADDMIKMQLAQSTDKKMVEDFKKSDQAQEIVNQMYGSKTNPSQSSWNTQKQILTQLQANKGASESTKKSDQAQEIINRMFSGANRR